MYQFQNNLLLHCWGVSLILGGVRSASVQSAPRTRKLRLGKATGSKAGNRTQGGCWGKSDLGGMIMRSIWFLLCLAFCLGQETASPCSSQDTSCILTVLAMRGLIREEQAARQARAEWDQREARGRGRGGEARYRPDCWEQDDWPASRGKRGTYETLQAENDETDAEEDSSPNRQGNYRTTEGRNGFRGSSEPSAGQGEGRRGRGRTPCLWEASYYTGDTQQTV